MNLFVQGAGLPLLFVLCSNVVIMGSVRQSLTHVQVFPSQGPCPSATAAATAGAHR